MDSIIFNNGTPIQAEELNALQERKAEAILERTTDLRSAGVVADKSPEQIVYTDGKTLGIFYLVAYNKTGERIEIPQNTDPALPAIYGLLPDENGKLVYGGQSLIPQKTYTLVVRYATVLAEPIQHHVVSGKMFLTSSNSTYELYLRDDQTLQEDDVVLATVNVSPTGVVSVDESVRYVSNIPASSVVGNIDSTSPGGSYGTDISFYQHINSIGSGTPTNTNPHGTTASDLGIDVGALADHQKLLHSDGIRSDNIGSLTSAMYPYYRRESLTDEEVVYIQPLSQNLNEIAVINGKSITPEQFQSVFSYSFSGMAGESYAGYYLFSYDSDSNQIVVNGPYDSENNQTFVQLLTTKALFPICSLKWAYVEYDVTGDATADVGSYNIIPSTFKDRRVFNNTSISNFRPNEIFALSQFAPVANDVAFLHNAQIIGTVSAPMYPVAGKTLNLNIDNDTEVSIMFEGANPVPVDSIIDQMLAKLTKKDSSGNTYLVAYPRVTKEGFVCISAPISVTIIEDAANGAESTLGFSSANKNMTSDTKELIREMIYYGERNGIILFNYNDSDDVSSIEYYLGGGRVLKNVFNYKNGYITHVNEIIEAL